MLLNVTAVKKERETQREAVRCEGLMQDIGDKDRLVSACVSL